MNNGTYDLKGKVKLNKYKEIAKIVIFFIFYIDFMIKVKMFASEFYTQSSFLSVTFYIDFMIKVKMFTSEFYTQSSFLSITLSRTIVHEAAESGRSFPPASNFV